MRLTIEFLGVPRLRAGVAEWELETESSELRLSDVLSRLEQQFPNLAQEFFEPGPDGRLILNRHGLISLNGHEFTRDPDRCLRQGDRLIVLSADLGG